MSFTRFKKKATTDAFLKSLIFALAVGITVGAVFLVLLKRNVIPLDPLFSLLFGFLAALISFGILFFIYRPSDKKVARRLDDEFLLDERVLTMLELTDSDSPIAELQREDTERLLSSIPTNSLKFGRIWALIVAMAISVTLLLTGLVIPAVAAPSPEDELVDDYEKNWRIASLKSLIERVSRDQYAEEGAKTSLIAIIEGLIDTIKDTDKEVVMKRAAVNAVLAVDGSRYVFSSALAYAKVMKAAGSEYNGLAKALESYDDLKFGDEMGKIISAFSAPIDESIVNFVDIFNTILVAAAMPETDALGQLFTKFKNDLRAVADDGGSKKDAELIAEDLAFAIYEPLIQQGDNDRIALVVRVELMSIFSLTAADFESEGVEPPENSGTGDVGEPEEKPEDDITPGAGYGKGDTLAGSDETLYDHDLGEMVNIPEVIDKYFAMFDEISDGMDPELKRAIEAYFESLKTPPIS